MTYYYLLLRPLLSISYWLGSFKFVYFVGVALHYIAALAVFFVLREECGTYIATLGAGMYVSSEELLNNVSLFYNPSFSISLFTISISILYFGLSFSRPTFTALASLIIGVSAQIHLSSLSFIPICTCIPKINILLPTY